MELDGQLTRKEEANQLRLTSSLQTLTEGSSQRSGGGGDQDMEEFFFFKAQATFKFLENIWFILQCCGAEPFFIGSGYRYIFSAPAPGKKISAPASPIKARLRPAPAPKNKF